MESGRKLLVRTGIRFAFIGTMLICNALFFWNVDARSGISAVLGTEPTSARVEEAGLLRMRITETRAYGFAMPSRLSPPAPDEAENRSR